MRRKHQFLSTALALACACLYSVSANSLSSRRKKTSPRLSNSNARLPKSSNAVVDEFPSVLTESEILLLSLVKNIEPAAFMDETSSTDTEKVRKFKEQGDQDLRQVFEQIDINEDQKMSYDELSLYFNYFNYNSSHTDMHKIFTQTDTDNDGVVSLEEINSNQALDESFTKRYKFVKVSSGEGLTESEFAAYTKLELFPHLVEIDLREDLAKLGENSRLDLLYLLLTSEDISAEDWEKMNLLKGVDFHEINTQNREDGLTIDEIKAYINLHSKESYEGQAIKKLDADSDGAISWSELNDKDESKVAFYYMVLRILKNAKTCENIFKKLDHEYMVKILKVLLVDGDDWQKSRTPLLYAASRGFTEVVEIILNEHKNEDRRKDLLGTTIDIQATDSSSNNAIHLAVWENQIEVLPLLLEAGVGINSKNVDTMTPLLYACLRNNEEAVTELMKSGTINVNFENSEGSTALTYAASFGNVNIIRLLFQKKGLKVNHLTKDGTNALMIASSWNRTEAVAELLDHQDINCDAMVKDSKYTAAMFASYHNYGQVFRIFTDNIDKCDFDLKDRFGWTAFDIAYYRGSESVTDLYSEIDDLNYFNMRISYQLRIKTFGVNKFHFYLILFNFVLPLGTLIIILIWNKRYSEDQSSSEALGTVGHETSVH